MSPSAPSSPHSDYSSPSDSPLPSPAFSPSTLPRSPVINVNINGGGASPRRAHARSLSHLKFDHLDFDSAPTSPSLPSPVSARSQSFHEDVLSRGDLVGEHLCLQNEPISRVPAPPRNVPLAQEPMQEFEVVRRLGTGSYAVVYLVREVVARREFSDDGCIGGRMDVMSADSDHGESREYGRNYAVKVLSKANLDQEALDAQMAEANIHQSIPSHPNIVTLHRTLETPSFLLLLLEFVPGADLFYFLEQARDHYEPDPATLASPISPTSADPSQSLDKATDSSDHASHSSNSSSSSHTPPTPSLLSTLNANQLLSRTRLRLIASMFAQMCEAVAACHDAGVFHRDIKPENFIVTDARAERERRVVVKLTDFGLSTMDAASADMDCGSAPYMSYECRNNCAPTYAPRAADVWSLGIVLINMLYHINPWTDTTQGVCTSFSFFRADPIAFFTSRFAGMTPAVATFLTERVFCILDSDDPLDKRGRRISAHEFGMWVKDLPALLGPGSSSLSSNGIALPPPTPVISTTPAMNSTTTSPCASTLSSPTAFSPPSLYSALQHHQQTQHQPMAFSSSTSSRVLPPGATVISHKRGASASSIGFSLSSVPQSRRPSSRQASISDHPAPTANAASGTASGTATPALRGRSLSRAPSFGVEGTPAGAANMIELPTVFDNGLEEDGEGEMEAEAEAEMEAEMDAEMDAEDAEVGTESGSRSTSVVRKRKRGARRGKGLQQQQLQQQAPPLPSSTVPSPGMVETLASASQLLARELSRQSRASQSGRPPAVHVSVPVHLVQAQAQAQTQQVQREPSLPSKPFALTSLPAKPAKSAPATPTIPSAPVTPATQAPAGAKVGIVKKASKWKLGFGKSSSNNGGGAKVPESGGVGSGAGYGNASGSGAGMGGRVDENVIRSNLGVGVGMGAIDANVHSSSIVNGHSPVRVRSQGSGQATPISMSPTPSSPHADARSRGRGTRPAPLAGLDGSSTWGPSSAINSQTIESWAHNVQTGNTSHPAGSFHSNTNGNANVSNATTNVRKANPSITNSERNVSPMSTRRPASSAASIAPSSTSSNWRSSSSTASTSTSAFTRYSNGSARSLSTAATSVSAGSWRNPSSASLASNKPSSSPAPSIHHAQNPGKGPAQGHPDMPPGVKFMTGVPWALHQLPRHMHPSPVGDIYYAQPPPRKPRVRKPKDLPQELPTINERPGRSPLSQRQDAGASATDLRGGSGSSNASFDGDVGDGVPRKVQKGQINALAKMLSAFKLS
ncbi:hypothetical protein BD410DRAFT_836860 [Rickenella mellea]|uniref:Protein kinase domain-containing protein n=1 Tax=Rickenella mellea TaxID=50990 RepID=A0A4Y7QGH7_9AGAM|nr:hypothetical protein BD410DRAFT_836860 [Rickenella mellea]